MDKEHSSESDGSVSGKQRWTIFLKNSKTDSWEELLPYSFVNIMCMCGCVYRPVFVIVITEHF